MLKQLLVGLICTFISNTLIASDWKELPKGNTGFYSENKAIGSRVILSDITTGKGIMDVALFTVNPTCISKGATGEAHMYVNTAFGVFQGSCHSLLKY